MASTKKSQKKDSGHAYHLPFLLYRQHLRSMKPLVPYIRRPPRICKSYWKAGPESTAMRMENSKLYPVKGLTVGFRHDPSPYRHRRNRSFEIKAFVIGSPSFTLIFYLMNTSFFYFIFITYKPLNPSNTESIHTFLPVLSHFGCKSHRTSLSYLNGAKTLASRFTSFFRSK